MNNVDEYGYYRCRHPYIKFKQIGRDELLKAGDIYWWRLKTPVNANDSVTTVGMIMDSNDGLQVLRPEIAGMSPEDFEVMKDMLNEAIAALKWAWKNMSPTDDIQHLPERRTQAEMLTGEAYGRPEETENTEPD